MLLMHIYLILRLDFPELDILVFRFMIGQGSRSTRVLLVI